MKTSSSPFRLGVLFCAVTFVALILTALPVSTRVTATSAAPEIWKVAPPAPRISEADRLSELAKRRQETMKQMGDKAIMVLFSTEPRVYTLDVDYPYRQENNLYYLTGIKQEGATLVLIPGAKKTREILFMPERNPRTETWTGKMMSSDEARQRSGIQEVWDSKLFNGFLATLAPRAESAIAKRGCTTDRAAKTTITTGSGHICVGGCQSATSCSRYRLTHREPKPLSLIL